ncbi:DnaJ family domain-containing protein [uncultured Shimia sp.]|uniref:DnaJ family domain-containing protein n=1 Tax=uncultured Shimia sp. TaxID=573152 RepID=UPI0025E5755B|nr:DnaJ family domain-containing protein [uncultured Shimia sp.]
MDRPPIDLIDQKIREAEAIGAFGNLKAVGGPLPKEDDVDNARLNRLMGEVGWAPEFVSLSRDLNWVREELHETAEKNRRQDILKEISMMDVEFVLAQKAQR